MPYIISFNNNRKEYYLVRRQQNLREWTSRRKDALVFHYTEEQILRYVNKHLSSLETVNPIFTSERRKGLVKIPK